MAVDFSKYTSNQSPPGIYTNPIPGPQLAINSSLPRAVGLFGMSVGYQTYIESVLINPDTNSTTPSASLTLEQSGINTNTLQVTDANTGYVYELNTDYTIVNVSGVNGSSTATYAIKRVISTANRIVPGQIIQVSYEYSDEKYFNPYTFYDYQDVVSAYGTPFRKNEDGTWTLQSELSLAAKFAFLNGAYQIVCVAVSPSTPGSPTDSDYETALNKLQDEPLVAVVVPCTGSKQTLFDKVRRHVITQSETRYERRAILGVDGSSSSIPTSQRKANAVALNEQRVLLVSPSSFDYFSPELDKTIKIGGQFMAASLAGMTVAMSFAQPLTHKRISGWQGISDTENMRDGEMTEESKKGLAVIEYNRQRNLRVRHGVTTNPSSLLLREWSIIGQQDALVYRLRDYLDDANLIGQPIYNYTLVNVKASAEAALQSLVRDALLVDYTGLSVRQLLTNPDVIEISFGWRPAFPLNYIILTFSVSLTTGSTSTGTTGNRSNNTSTAQITTPTASVTNSFGGPSNTLQSF